MIQVRGDGDLHSKGSGGGRGRRPYFSPILSIEPTGSADGLMWNRNGGKESRKTA